MADLDLDPQTITWGIVDVGAINWALQEFADFNLVTEILGSNPTLGYGLIGVAGAVSLSEKLGFTSFFDA